MNAKNPATNPGAPMAAARRPLEGIRVLDLTWALAGPYCTLHLALLGAEVIKIESITSLDAMRRGDYALDGDLERSPTFNSVGLHKLGLRLNLKQSAAVALVKALAGISDVLVQNFRPGVLERLGLGYEELRRSNPTIVFASSSAFGSSGPLRRYPGYASVFSASGGLGHITGYEDGPPVEIRDSIDLRVGATLAYAILTALYHRRNTGTGQTIDLSSMEAIVALSGHTTLAYVLTGETARRRGNRDDAMAPHGVYRCRGEDAWISIAVATDREFRALCGAMGRPGLARDARFADPYRRLRHAEELDEAVEGWTRKHTPHAMMRLLQKIGVAAVPAFNSKELVHDMHLQARGAWRNVDHPRMGQRRVQGLSWQTVGAATQVSMPAPTLGQHNDFILREVLGVPAGEVDRLDAGGVFE